ncbi:hypothetical protein Dimus_023376, partial [Dionaea muscipula]
AWSPEVEAAPKLAWKHAARHAQSSGQHACRHAMAEPPTKHASRGRRATSYNGQQQRRPAPSWRVASSGVRRQAATPPAVVPGGGQQALPRASTRPAGSELPCKPSSRTGNFLTTELPSSGGGAIRLASSGVSWLAYI